MTGGSFQSFQGPLTAVPPPLHSPKGMQFAWSVQGDRWIAWNSAALLHWRRDNNAIASVLITWRCRIKKKKKNQNKKSNKICKPNHYKTRKIHKSQVWERFTQPHPNKAHRVLIQHIETETKLPSFCRRHFQIHFLEWKCKNFAFKISLEFVLKVPFNNIPTLV